MPIYKVETVSMFKHVYLIDAKEASHALDELLCTDVEEVHQEHLDEIVVSTKKVSLEEAKDAIIGSMNEHLGFRNIHRIDYGRD